MLKTLDRPIDIKTEIVTITPAIAEAYLSKNIKNRKPSRSTIDTYARDMRTGSWVLNGDAIRFDCDGNLIDGQHRLRACIKADSNFQSLVIYNLQHLAQDTIDGGRVRRPADVMQIHGITGANLRTAALRLMCGIKMDVNSVVTHKASTSEILAMNERHPNFGKSLHVQKNTIGVRPAMLVVVHYIGKNLLDDAPNYADEFANVFATGIPAYKGCPAILVRERAIQGRLRNQPLTSGAMFNLMVYSWNHFRKRKQVRMVKALSEVRFDDLDIRKL